MSNPPNVPQIDPSRYSNLRSSNEYQELCQLQQEMEQNRQRQWALYQRLQQSFVSIPPSGQNALEPQKPYI